MLKPLPVSVLETLPAIYEAAVDGLLAAELDALQQTVVVLDDDPTGIQTVHGVFVYTDWSEETLTEALADGAPMFFVLTNSRGMTTSETAQVHADISRNLAAASEKTGRDFILISRSDSTLRGHYPLETETLRAGLEQQTGKVFDGEIIMPFFLEGGRYTIGNVHYVKEGDWLIPAGQTEFAKDKSFGYTHSDLPHWCEEKSGGAYKAEDVLCISIEELRAGDYDAIADRLLSVKHFGKIIVNAAAYADVKAFGIAFCRAVAKGGQYLFRSAATITKVLGGVPDRPLLTKAELTASGSGNGGIVLVGSHVNKTTAQLAELRNCRYPMEFIEFNQHLVLEEGGLEREVARVIALAEENICKGRSVAVYTRRERFDLDTDDPDKQLEVSVRISDAVTSIIGKLTVQPGFIIAKGGITSSDVGVKALRVRRAEVMGQVRPGIPVWLTGAESKFPGMPYIIFHGNVGSVDDLRVIAELLMGEDGKDYLKQYLACCGALCFEDDYTDRKKRKAHNAAMTQLEALHSELAQLDCTEIMAELLRNEDERVQLNAAAFCLRQGLHETRARQILSTLSETSRDASIGFSASMVLKTTG